MPEASQIPDLTPGYHPAFEADARLIAENVVMAIARMRGEEPYAPGGSAGAVAALMRALLTVMPARSDRTLSEACNGALAGLPGHEGPLPWVEAVDVTDGSVTLRAP